MFLKLAFKNIMRNRRRTIITEIAIVVGIVIIIFLGGFLESMQVGWADQLISGNTGHLQIINQEYFANQKTRPLKATIRDYRALAAAIMSFPEVETATPLLSFGGLIGTGENSTTFFGSGGIPIGIAKTLPRQGEMIKEGRLPSARNALEGALGQGLARQLGVKIGDVLLIVSKTVDGQMNATDLEITGLLTTGEVQIDDNLVLANYENVANLLDMEGRATELIVRLKSTAQLRAGLAQINQFLAKQYPELKAYAWTDIYQQFGQVMTMFGGIAFIVGGIIFFLVAIGIANTMVMSIFERTREIGTIMAIGTERGQVLKLFMLEGLAIGIVGAVIGVALGSVVTLIFGKYGVYMPPPPGANTGYWIYPVITLKHVLGACAIAIGMSTLATIYPARLAAKMDPVEALRQK